MIDFLVLYLPALLRYLFHKGYRNFITKLVQSLLDLSRCGHSLLHRYLLLLRPLLIIDVAELFVLVKRIGVVIMRINTVNNRIHIRLNIAIGTRVCHPSPKYFNLIIIE